MHYHAVLDSLWMKEKEAIVETLGHYQNDVCQPISQLECYIHCLKRENTELFNEGHNMTLWEILFSKRKRHATILDKLHTNKYLIRNAESELKEAYNHMYRMSIRMQHHWFDLVGVGYGEKDSRLTEDDFLLLDKRWAELNPKQEVNND